MDRFRRVAMAAAALAGVVTLAIESRFLVPLLLDRSGDANPLAKAIAVLWQIAIVLLLALKPSQGAASAAAAASLLGWFALAPTGAGAVLFTYWGGISASQTALVLLSLTLQVVAMLAALAGRLRGSTAPSPSPNQAGPGSAVA